MGAVLLVLALGVAGLDAVGALVVIPAILAGARTRVVLAFAAAALASTVLAGVLVTGALDLLLPWLRGVLDAPGWLRVLVQVLLATALGWWAARRGGTDELEVPPFVRTLLTTSGGLGAVGMLWGLSALAEPTFLGVALLLADGPGLATTAGAFALWFLVSQAPLCLVAGTLVVARDSRAVQRTIDVARTSAGVGVLLSRVIAGAVALALVANAATWVVTGAFWPV